MRLRQIAKFMDEGVPENMTLAETVVLGAYAACVAMTALSVAYAGILIWIAIGEMGVAP